MTDRHLNFFDILTVLFIGLKITGHIDWSWLLVLSPLLFTYVCAAVALVLVGTGLRTRVKDR